MRECARVQECLYDSGRGISGQLGMLGEDILGGEQIQRRLTCTS